MSFYYDNVRNRKRRSISYNKTGKGYRNRILLQVVYPELLKEISVIL